jgi:hypothetical protein
MCNTRGAAVVAVLRQRLFLLTLSYYIDNKCKDYILCAYCSEARDYFWDTLFSNISQKVSYKTSIPEKYKRTLFSNGKLVQPRKLDNSQIGIICPAETPEGSSVGLVKNMALSTNISIAMNITHI